MTKTTWEWELPKALQEHLRDDWQCTQHFGLILDKLLPSKGKYIDKGKDKEVDLGGKEGFNHRWLSEWIAAYNVQTFPEFIKYHPKRWQKMVEAGGGISQQMTTASPLIVGLGGGHVLETSITLDRNTGMPLIPGSALKGLARNVGLIEVARAVLQEPQIDDLTQLEDELIAGKRSGFTKQKQTPDFTIVEQFIHIFGTPEAAGNVAFIDAIYAGDKQPAYHLDIMNPHFPKYYGDSGKTAPSDDQNPIPVPYLTVDVGQKFQFAVLPRRQGVTQWLDIAWKWLQEGLTEFGVGAKTSQGYGLFK